MLRWLSLALLTIFISACASTPAPPPEPDYPSVSLSRPGQPPLVIEDDGTPARHALYQQALELQSLDAEMDRWRNGPNAGDEVHQQMLAVMMQNRDDALGALEQGWLAAGSRSWESAAGYAVEAGKDIQSSQQAITSGVPSSLFCSTQISSTSSASRLHYLPEGIYREGGEDWMSYTPGAKIKIGNYRFRVASGDEVYLEKVTILQDPFVHQIQPR